MNADAIDLPAVIAEITPIFHDYERALMTNDLVALDAFFWDDERVTRYGIADCQHGIEALRTYRAATEAPTFNRRLEHLCLHTFGLACAVAQVEFVRSDTPLRGYQTQTWVKLEGAWKIVAAHVSMIPAPG
jgi:hypothetical protein